MQVEGKNTREIQNFAAPAVTYTCVMGYDPEATLREFMADVTRRETPSDQADILETLLIQRIRYQHYRDGLTEYAVGALIEIYYNDTDRREDIQETLTNFGIRVGNDKHARNDCLREGVFFPREP